jgi:carboxymethylenebutenolidase
MMTDLTAADGHRFGAYVAGPEDAKHALVIVQEIFGVNSHMRRVADAFAAEGYRVVCPALFDRAERGVELG